MPLKNDTNFLDRVAQETDDLRLLELFFILTKLTITQYTKTKYRT